MQPHRRGSHALARRDGLRGGRSEDAVGSTTRQDDQVARLQRQWLALGQLQLRPPLQDEVIRCHTLGQGRVRQMPGLAEATTDIQAGAHRMQGQETAEGIHRASLNSFLEVSFLSNFKPFSSIHNFIERA